MNEGVMKTLELDRRCREHPHMTDDDTFLGNIRRAGLGAVRQTKMSIRLDS